MFIKILTPNHNGKIELTVKDLECLIQEAVDKAIKEKCASCSRGYYGYLSTTTPAINLKDSSLEDNWKPYEITCGTAKSLTSKLDDTLSTAKTTGNTIGINKNMLD